MRAKLELKPPSKRSPYWYIRGSYEGVGPLCRSTKTRDRATAAAILAQLKKDIREGRIQRDAGPTFATAAIAYMNDGGERQFMDPIIRQIGRMPLAHIDQDAIDAAATAIAGQRSPATRNRTVFTPISAVLRHAGVHLVIRRPRGAQGTPRRHWLRPEEIERFLDASWGIHPRFAALCALLYYCGPRLSEALAIQVEDVHLEAGFIDVPDTKNGEPQRLALVPYVSRAIAIALMQPGNRTWTEQQLPRTKGSLFCLTKSGALYTLFNQVAVTAGVAIPEDVSFHIFRHSYGAQMRARKIKLTDTGRWTSRGGAAPYEHYEISEAALAAMTFPGADGAPKLKSTG